MEKDRGGPCCHGTSLLFVVIVSPHGPVPSLKNKECPQTLGTLFKVIRDGSFQSLELGLPDSSTSSLLLRAWILQVFEMESL